VLKTVTGPCPSCSHDIEYRYQTEDIPYFSDILIISANCPHCGYRYVDTQLLKSGAPSRHTLRVSCPEDLAVRIVRSMTASLAIPELGVEINPGPACTGFVTNIEGVLDRVGQVVEATCRWNEGETKETACALLERIAQAREGRFPFTLILDDPSGNSAIVSEKAEKTALEIGTDNC
jgi:zinc finger protein